MSWFRLDDKFHAHPKVLAAGNAAVGLWVRCATWSAAHHTDGVIPASIARLYGTPREIKAVTAAGLWSATVDGFTIGDFLDYNPSAEEVAERSAKRADAGRKGGSRSGEVRSKREANASLLLRPETNPVPSRPDPLKKSSSVSTVSGPGEAGRDDPRIAAAIALHAERVMSQQTVSTHNGQTTSNPVAYRRIVVANALVEHGQALRDALASDGTLSADRLAAHVFGWQDAKPKAPEACGDDPECNAGWRFDEVGNVCRPCALCGAGAHHARNMERLDVIDGADAPRLRVVQ